MQTPATPMVDEKYGTAAAIMALPAARLIAILNDSNASDFARAKACQQLAVVGDGAAVPALAALLEEEKFSHYARFALEPNPDPAAGQALRQALAKLRGNLRVGVINSLGVRRDAKALDLLAPLLRDQDPETARAAAAAMARIRPRL